MEIGQKVEITEKYVKGKYVKEKYVKEKHKNIESLDGYEFFVRTWKTAKIKKTKGVFVGLRLLKDIAFSEMLDHAGELSYVRHCVIKNTKVALIAINKKQLLYVPLDNFVIVND